MKIVENTDHRLVIEHKPWLLAGAVWAMGLAALYGAITGKQISSIGEHILVAALGVGMTFVAWYFFAFLRITFDRPGNRVEHSSLRLGRSTSKFLVLSKVRSAKLEAQWSEGSRLTRLILETEDGPAALEFGFSSGDRTAIEAEVNNWLAKSGGVDRNP